MHAQAYRFVLYAIIRVLMFRIVQGTHRVLRLILRRVQTIAITTSLSAMKYRVTIRLHVKKLLQ